MTFLAKLKGALGLKAEKPARIEPPAFRNSTIKPKPRKPRFGDDRAYLALVRQLPCVICDNWGFRQITPTEAHHTICGRYSQSKTPDRQSIPLCSAHHRGAEGIHTQRAWWVKNFGPDTDYIAITQDAVERLNNKSFKNRG